MIFKGLAIAAVLLATTQVPPLAPATAHTGAAPQAQSPYPSSPQGQAKPDCNGVPCEAQQPHVIVAVSPPPPTPWLLHDKILWGAELVLAILGYAGIMLALRTLKKIERHTEAFEDSLAVVEATAKTASTTATASEEAALAALLHAQAIVHAERPWVLVTAEPTRGVESSFEITATNRGRSPARVTGAQDQVLIAKDEEDLPEIAEYMQVATTARFVPIILLPGESATLKSFRREDARGFCDSDEMFESIESWTQKMFLVGRVSYSDLLSPAPSEAHETNWCCWYIHGKQRSALVPAGPAAYSSHT